MVRITRKSALLLPNAFEVLLSRFGSFGLQQTANTPNAAAYTLDGFARILIAFAVCGNLRNAEVNTQHGFAGGFGRIGFNYDVQVETAVFGIKAQVGRAGFPAQIAAVVAA